MGTKAAPDRGLAKAPAAGAATPLLDAVTAAAHAARATPIHPFVDRLMPILALYPASVISWIRTPHRNARVGGHPQSYHLDGCAVDLIPDNAAHISDIVVAARAAGLDAVDHRDSVHLEYDYRKHRST